MIDLRSDTVTLPKEEMLNEILNAKLGDDIQGDDPTVKELEKVASSLLGMEDALLTISGTMANQIAVMALTNRGEEIILGAESHLYNLEVAGLATLSQVQARPISVIDGSFNIEEIERTIHPGDIQRAKTSLICLENTYNLNKGHIVPLENMKKIKELSEHHSLPVYLDGARLFNASVALGIKPADICQYTDAVQFCLTKGLGCPLGSILVGSKEFINNARRMRQRLGGGMRQAGIIAAPGIYALNHMIDRLNEDHEKAYYFAQRLSVIDGISLNLQDVQTNILSLTITDEKWSAKKLVDELKHKGILIKKINEKEVRMIVHYEISIYDLDKVISTIHEIFDDR